MPTLAERTSFTRQTPDKKNESLERHLTMSGRPEVNLDVQDIADRTKHGYAIGSRLDHSQGVGDGQQ
jgi:hypothetical protein